MPPALEDMQAEIGDFRGPLLQAKLPLADHGFLYGDAVYETIRTLGGKVFELAAHLRRLRQSAAGIYLGVPWDDPELERRLESFRQFLGGSDHYLRLIVTRGSAPLGYASHPQQQAQCIFLGGPFRAPQPDQLGPGLSATVVSRLRNSQQALSPHLKTNNLLNPRLAAMEANDRGFDEALLLNQRGDFTEGSNCNLFFASFAGTLVTPNLDSGLLPGITRQLLLDLAREDGMAVEERPVHREELAQFQEAFLTSTTRTIYPLRRIDDWRLLGRGPVTERLIGLFQKRFGEL